MNKEVREQAETERGRFEAQVRGIVSWQFSGVTNCTEAAYNDSLRIIGEQVFEEIEKLGYRLIKPESLTVLSPEQRIKVANDALKSHYRETYETKRVPSDYLLMFTEGGEADAIAYASAFEQLQHTKRELGELKG